MTDFQKLVLMIQPVRLQGLIWHAVLKSQRLAVIWESADFDIVESLNQLEAAGLPLPNLLLIDVRLKDFNPYSFCRWCRDRYPSVKVLLTNSAQREIEPSERQWAIYQGASDLIAGFRRDNLVTSVTTGVKRLLEILDNQSLDNSALIAVLFAMKRELEARQTQTSESDSDQMGGGDGRRPSQDHSANQKTNSPGGKPIFSAPDVHKNGKGSSPSQTDDLEDPKSALEDEDTTDGGSRSRRRYRGTNY
jgi:CheY-like chemotaxis protein